MQFWHVLLLGTFPIVAIQCETLGGYGARLRDCEARSFDIAEFIAHDVSSATRLDHAALRRLWIGINEKFVIYGLLLFCSEKRLCSTAVGILSILQMRLE
jgi:hypothetical protein